MTAEVVEQHPQTRGGAKAQFVISLVLAMWIFYEYFKWFPSGR